MIAATVATNDLTRKLSARAQKIGRRHGELIAAAHKQGNTNWRSARALWPDMTLD